jgi:hypothetical protein
MDKKRAQWYLDKDIHAWVAASAIRFGVTPTAFVGKALRYVAGDMTPTERREFLFVLRQCPDFHDVWKK